MRKKQTAVSKVLEVLKILKSEGVDIKKIPLNLMVDGKQVYTKLSDIKQDGINIVGIAQRHDLDLNYKIGGQIVVLRQAYKGKSGYLITEEEKEEARLLGMIKEKSSNSELLDLLELLEKEGVDVTKIPKRKTIKGKFATTVLRDIKQDGIDIEKIIEKHNLDPNYIIGSKIHGLLAVCRGYNSYAITESDVRRAERLGITEKQSTFSELLDILEILEMEDINLEDIPKSKTVNGKTTSTTLADIKHKKIENILMKHSLDRNYKIGQKLTDAEQALKGHRYAKISKGEKIRAMSLGLLKIHKKTMLSEALDVLEKLQQDGINLVAVPQTRREKGKRVSTELRDIKQDGIDVQEIIAKHGLNQEYKIGIKITRLCQAYNGKSKQPITLEDKRRIEALGIVQVADMDVEQASLQYQLQEAEQLKRKAEQYEDNKEKKV